MEIKMVHNYLTTLILGRDLFKRLFSDLTVVHEEILYKIR